MLARRWAFLTHRLAGAAVPRARRRCSRLARGARKLARTCAPIRELVEWTERLARETAPAAPADEPLAVREVQALRDALRSASEQLPARRRALEAERVRAWELARRVAHG